MEEIAGRSYNLVMLEVEEDKVNNPEDWNCEVSTSMGLIKKRRPTDTAAVEEDIQDLDLDLDRTCFVEEDIHCAVGRLRSLGLDTPLLSEKSSCHKSQS